MVKMLHIKRTKAKGRDYYYFDTGQKDDAGKAIWKRLPDPRDRTFGAIYAAMLGHRERRASPAALLTVAGLVNLYQTSEHFKRLRPASQRVYGTYHNRLISLVGNAPANELERRDVMLMIDRMAATPGAANMLIRTGNALYVWAIKREHVRENPFTNIDEFEGGEHEPWPQHLIDAALASQNETVRLAVHLLYYTAQRISDVCKMTWRDIENGRVNVKQAKTGKELSIKMHGALVDELARYERSLSTIIPGEPGAQKAQRIRFALQAFAAEHGLKVVPHGLRKNAVIALLANECSVAEVAAISGQSFAMVEYYSKRRAQDKLADSAVLKWERNKR